VNRQIDIHEIAEIEIEDAADFYDMQSPGLGTAFIDEFQRSLARIAEFPHAAPLIQGRVRKKFLNRFPFSVIYSVKPEKIRILAVAHRKRRPFYWRGRR
jgi:plasmid stabilization system protein ParE